MMKTAKSILSLNCKEALDFLMTSGQYHGFELPEYFDFDKMCARLRKLPNNVYLQLWLQNITWRRDKASGQCPYDARMCHVVAGDSTAPLWNNAWLRPELTKGFPQASVVNKDTLNKGDNVIVFKETRAYDETAY